MSVKKILGAILLLGLVYLVESQIGWKNTIEPWKQLDYQNILLALLFVFTSYAIRALRLLHYFKDQLAGRFFAALRLMMIHNLWNVLLPMRTGELSFPILMQTNFSINPHRSVPALFWFRLLDLYVVLMVGVIALSLTGDNALTSAVIAVVLTSMVPICWKLAPAILVRLEHSGMDRIAALATRIRDSMPTGWHTLLGSLGWTILNWGIKLLSFAWILSLFIPLSLPIALFGSIGGELTSVLPVHGIAGAGTYEAGIVAALLPFSINAKEALMAAVNLHIFVLSCAILGGLAGYLLPVAGNKNDTNKNAAH